MYQVVAATCLHIASKCQHTQGISLTDLVFSADNTFREKHILLIEKGLLKHISFQLSDMTVFDFCTLYMNHVGRPYDDRNGKYYWIVRYLSELSEGKGETVVLWQWFHGGVGWN